MKEDTVKTRLKVNDNVVVTAGADRGRRGKILKIGKKAGRVIVEGINKRNKRLKATQENPKGSVLNIEFPINISNVMVFCDKCKKGVRIGVLVKDGKKNRVCKKCGKNLD